MIKGDLGYLLVDDDLTSNLLCRLLISKFDSAAHIEDFSIPEKGLQYIENLKETNKMETSNSIILFLDVNMPTMTGWEFLDHFILFPENVKSLFHIYILSSAIEDFEAERIKYPFVKGFLSKPLKKNDLIRIEDKILKGKT